MNPPEKKKTAWWFQTPLKNIGRNGNLPQVEVKLKKYLNCHHLEYIKDLFYIITAGLGAPTGGYT